MDFLELCNRVASDSATFRENAFTTVVDQTGRPGTIVRYTADAYRQVQNRHDGWLWLRSRFSGDTVAATPSYEATGFIDQTSGLLIDRFRNWICRGRTEDRFKLYDPAIGYADAGRLVYRPWNEFEERHIYTDAPTGKPQYFSFDPQRRLWLAPTPDQVYKIVGPYRKSTQILATDTDIPEMPSDFHDVIPLFALILLGMRDETPQQLPLWTMRQNELFCALERDQLEKLSFGKPLA